jgi:hypothetical protein
MRAYIANLGKHNVHWPVCKAENVLTLETSQILFDFWTKNDRPGWIDWAAANEKMVNGQPATAPVASRWFNLISIFHDTQDDVWIHREGDHLFWTTSTHGRITQSDYADPKGKSRKFLLLKRPTQPWKNRSRDGRNLVWRSLHPKAHHFLQTEATYQEIANDRRYKEYALSLVEGEPLRELHELPEWQDALGKKTTVTTFSTLEITIYDAVRQIGRTVLRADGRIVETTSKIKNFLVSEEDMRNFLRKLYDDQQGLCALTGLRMLLNDDEGPKDLRLSVDRIDSDGHYEPENVQLVCRFANFWKSNGDNNRFKELVELVRTTAAASSGI